MVSVRIPLLAPVLVEQDQRRALEVPSDVAVVVAELGDDLLVPALAHACHLISVPAGALVLRCIRQP
jgi:hypothetical protein